MAGRRFRLLSRNRSAVAAKAMQGELASQSEEYGSWAGDQEMLAHRAYLIADAMLKAREAR